MDIDLKKLNRGQKRLAAVLFIEMRFRITKKRKGLLPGRDIDVIEILHILDKLETEIVSQS